MRMLGRIGITTIAVLAALGAVTYVALESGGVVVLRTFDAAGAAHESRVWLAEDGSGTAWLEAAAPDKPFYRRLIARPDVEVVRDGTVARMAATPEPGAAGHRRIREMLRAKYGWRDAWICLLVDTSASVAVRLDPRSLPPDSLSPSGAEVR